MIRLRNRQMNHETVPGVPPLQQDDYKLKDTSPQLGERLSTTYDLVEQTYHLYVRVVKAKDLPVGSDPYAEVKLGNYRGRTRHFEKNSYPEWNQVFAFSKDRVQSSTLEVYVKDKEMFGRDDFIGKVVFDLNEVPTRVPPDSPLAPQWYRLADRRGQCSEIMVAVWMGTQADEAFPEAWHSDASSAHGEGVFNVRSKVYVSFREGASWKPNTENEDKFRADDESAME
ncbi:hypothetical protein L2E82_14823 [Cichorium intybus]|uniref:Uncharacterized protein n=1 Tax=Cichorium intybus TaxID=13427 RepID=A0ACB9F127_CICIN|nr:hypothetical protein L2E82_14823 [Cichorium intybus]